MLKEKNLLDELNTSEMQIKIKQYEELLSIYREEMKLKDMKISYYEIQNKQLIRKNGIKFFNKNFDIASDKLDLKNEISKQTMNFTPIHSSSNLNEQTNKSIEDDMIIKGNICVIENELTRYNQPQRDESMSSYNNEKNEDIPSNNVNYELYNPNEKIIFNDEPTLHCEIDNVDDIPYKNQVFQNLLSSKENTSNKNKLSSIYNKRLKIKDEMYNDNIENFPNFLSPKQNKNIKNQFKSIDQLVESPKLFQMSASDRNKFFGKPKEPLILQNSCKDLQTENHLNTMLFSPNHKETKHRTFGSYSSSIHAQILQRPSRNKEVSSTKCPLPSNDYGDLFKKLSSRGNDAALLKMSINTSGKTGSPKIRLDNVRDNSRGNSETGTSTSYQKYNTLKKNNLQSVLNSYVSKKLGDSESVYGMMIQKSVKELKRIDSSRKFKFS